MALSTKHLLGIKDLNPSDISLILQTAQQFKEVLQRPIKKVPSLRDVTIVNLFYESSTRTRISFELAEKDCLQILSTSVLPVLQYQKVKPCWILSITFYL